VVLVIAPSVSKAAQCAAPIELGPKNTMYPIVLGPDTVPLVADAEMARRKPELVLLSGMTHGNVSTDILDVVPEALASVDDAHVGLYSEVVFGALTKAARDYLEAQMTTGVYREYKVEFVRRYIDQGRAEGEAKGEAKALLMVLDSRGIELTAAQRDRIASCTDLEMLEDWLSRAAAVASAEELLD
jgi:hypothetical protein